MNELTRVELRETVFRSSGPAEVWFTPAGSEEPVFVGVTQGPIEGYRSLHLEAKLPLFLGGPQ